MIYMAEKDYLHLRDSDSGICTSCYHVKYGDTEPDAENYQCENERCQKKRVQGIENLVIGGRISFETKFDVPYVVLRKKFTGEVKAYKIRGF